MDLALLIANLVLDAVTLAVLGVYLYIAVLTNRQVAASQEQAQASQKEAQVSQAALELTQRPFLYPTGGLAMEVGATGSSSHFNFDELDASGQIVVLSNAGNGIALNIRGVLLQPCPEHAIGLSFRPRMRSITLDTPLRPGDEVRPRTKASQLPFTWTTTLTATPESALVAPRRTPPVDFPVATRLTLTFEDTLGHTHGCQFDYVETAVVAAGRWEFFRFYPYPEVPEGLAALTRRLEVEFQTALLARPPLTNPAHEPERFE